MFGTDWRRTVIGLWWTAACLPLFVEAGLTWQRSQSRTLGETRVQQFGTELALRLPAQDLRAGSIRRVNELGGHHRASLCLPATPQPSASFILVVGSAATSSDEEFEVTLKIEALNDCSRASGVPLARQLPRQINPPDCPMSGLTETRLSGTPHQVWFANKPASRIAAESQTSPQGKRDSARRVFFIHSQTGRLDDPASHLALDCWLAAESPAVRVFVEANVPHEERLQELIAAVARLAEDSIGPAIQAIVGSVRDVDRDGRLAVVLTSRLGQPGGAFAEVDGLTRASDFRDEVPRPFGNSADVLFLNSRLSPSEQLCAILAHEWSHAAVFSRRYGPSRAPLGLETSNSLREPPQHQPPIVEDDWLNEGLAHLIEVQASGSLSNLADRIEQFLAKPEAAPLIVRTYSRTTYWRHHGCRGATYLFLDWCQQQSGPEFLDRLIDSESIGIENVEAATGRSFEELFRDWTVSLGQSLAGDGPVALTKASPPINAGDSIAPALRTVERNVVNQSSWSAHSCLRPQSRSWHSADSGSREISVRLRGTTATFVRLTLDGSTENRCLVAKAPPGCQLQLTAITEESCSMSPTLETRSANK